MPNKNETILTRIEANLNDNHTAEFTFLNAEGEPFTKKYIQVVADAKTIASYLTHHYKSQSRIILIFPPGLDFISAILGCFYAGMIAVPAYPLQNPRHAYRLHGIINSCTPEVILGNKRVVEDLSKIDSFSSINKVITEEILQGKIAQSFEPHVSPEMIAFLQYTSGSTGTPKGVIVTHANLLHNLKTMKQGFAFGKNKPSVLWVPLQHDLGLIAGVLSSIYNHNDLILMSPVSVIQRPFRWLKALSDYKPYFTAGPDFSYQLCASKVSDEELAELDLSFVEYALSAAEPNRYQTMEKFLTRFSVCGFKPEAYCVGYGLAEATVHVTTNTPHQKSHYLDVSKVALEKGLIETPQSIEDTHRLMSAGTLHPEHELVIVHPEKFIRCTENEVGEIWEHSKSVAKGYWNNEEATEATFHAKIKGEKKKYLRTGDLGFIRGDQLYTTGRQKDLLIIDGRNIYPQDLEDCIDLAHEYIKPGCTAAFSVDTGTREALVICAEIQRTAAKKDLSQVIPALRHAIASQFEIAVDTVKLLKPGFSFKTTSGKIQRTATKNAYLKEELVCFTSELAHSKNQNNSWHHQVHEVLCEVLALKKISRDQRFTELGGTSLHAKLLHHKLQEMTGLNLSPTIAFDYPTLGELTEFLEITCNKTETSKSKVTAPPQADKIAIIGISCRLPGNVMNLDDLWSLLSEGRDAIGTLPAWRWDIERYEEETQKRINQAGILEDIDLFDAPFFNISPKEAKMMDPQHRILLETVWHALEDAGIAPDSLKKQLIGVYIGSTGADYKNLIVKTDNDENINPYFVLDTASSVLAGRVAYFLGTQGPAETIDTACSSSLVALSEACASLLSGQTSMAIAGGVNVILYPENSIGLMRANMLSPTNRCRTFSEDADGYVRGEGCGVVILKRLSEALKDNDQIHAVIDGFAINQDGASSGLTVPNLTAQRDLIEAALSRAQLTSDSIDYIEAHGSATELGDPIEVGAINEVFGKKERPRALYLGSIKSNIGHLEAAAGIGGLLKVIVSLKKQEIPRNIHLKALNPKLDCDVTPIEIVLKNTKWHRFGKPRCAGVSSFGFSGTNAHVILEEAPASLSRENLDSLPHEQLFVLSAKKLESLERLIMAYADYLEHTSDPLADICYTASVGRMHFNYRIALIVKDTQDLLKQLKNKSLMIKEVTIEDDLVASNDLAELKHAYLLGKSINFNAYYTPYARAVHKISLPGYCFDRNRYWITINQEKEGSDVVSNPLIYIENYQKYHFGHEITPPVNQRILVYGNHEKVLRNSLYEPITETLDESFEQSVVIYLYDGEFEKLIHFTKKMSTASPKVFILITTHTFHIEGQVRAESRRVLGFFKCLQKEWAHVSCYFLDLNSVADAESMVSYLLHHKCDEPVIIKTDKIYVPRLSLATSINNFSEENHYKSTGCYLIIGGTGGLGISLIEHLVSKGVKHLLITSRHEVDESLARVFDEYIKKDVFIEHFQIDASDENLSALFESMMDKKIVINGVFLLAGVIKDGLLDTLNIKDYEQVSLPKIKAGTILARLVKKNPVDFLVFFSSATSIIGNAGQTNYGAANGYLDGLAYELNDQGQYALSINWGSFLGSGMAKHLNKDFAKRGIIPINAKKGFIAMDKVLANKLTQAAILDMNWNLLKQNNNTYLEEFYPKKIESGEDWLNLIAGSSEEEQSGLVLEKIKQLVGDSLGISPEEALDVNKLFSAYGMDSIIAINLKNKLVEVMGVKVIFSNSIAYDYPNINTLHQYIAQNLIHSNQTGYSKASNENTTSPSFLSEITLPIATEVLQHELFVNRKIISINEWENFLISNDNVEYKATKLQKNLLHLYKINPDKLPYHVFSVKRIVSSVDFQKLTLAINLVVAENPCFRISMREDKTYGLIFKTTKDLSLDINFIENDNVPQALMEILNQEIALAEKSLIRVYVMNKNLLILKVNHMICDGLSLEMVFDKIYQYYVKDINHVDLLDADYINYVANLSHNNEHYTKSYIKYLQDLNPLIKDHVSEALPGKQKGKCIHQPISSETKKSITNFCMQNICSEYAFYLTVYAKALSHNLKDSKIYTSIVKSNRSHLPNQNLLGYFADNVPLLLELDKKKSFKEQVHYVQNRIIELSSNFSEPLLWSEYEENGYVQPDYIFNHFKTSESNELFEEHYELTQSMLANIDEISLWNVLEQEKISLMIRSTSFIDDFLVIYNEDEITTEEVHDLLNSINKIIKSIVENH